MEFKEEVNKIIADTLGFDLRINAYGGYFLGVKRIVLLTDKKIAVETTDKRSIEISGNSLTVKKLDNRDFAFCGEVTCAEVKRL